MTPEDPVPSNVVGSPTSTWLCPTASATGGFTGGGGRVVNPTTTAAARKFPGSLSSFAVIANVALYAVLDFKGLCVTSKTSPPKLLTDHSSPSPPGSGERAKAVAKELRSTPSVHTNHRSQVDLCPDAPSAGKLTRRAGGVESIVKTAALVSEAAFPAESVAVMRTRTLEESTLGSAHG